jgi:zinc protease
VKIRYPTTYVRKVKLIHGLGDYMSKKRLSFIMVLIGAMFYGQLIMAKGAIMPDTNTESFKLSNGLTIIVREDHRAPVMVSQVWYKVGSSSERRGLTGISHALEHMMFQGSKAFPNDEFSTTIAAYGGNNNAFTTEDYTAYYEEMASEHLDIAFKTESDRMNNLLLQEDKFTSEIEVVKEERRMRVDDNPQMYAWERFMAVANPAGPYHHPVIGWQDDLDNMTIEDLRDWYKMWYSPNNAIIVVVGDVKSENVKTLAEKYFGQIPAKELPSIKPIQELTHVGLRRIEVERKAELPMLIMGFAVPSLKSAQDIKEAFALYLAASILDQGESSRFAREIIRKEKAASVDASYDLLQRYDSQWTLTGVPTENSNVKEVEKIFWAQIKSLQNQLVSDDELNRVKTQLLAHEIFEKDSMSDQAIILGILASLDLPWTLADEFIENIKAVTKEEIQQVANKYFVPNRATIAELIPQTMMEVA